MVDVVWSAQQDGDGLHHRYDLMQMAVSRPIQVHAGVFISRQVMLQKKMGWMVIRYEKQVDLKC